MIDEGTRGPISSVATVEAAPPVCLHLLFALILGINLSLFISLLEDGIFGRLCFGSHMLMILICIPV